MLSPSDAGLFNAFPWLGRCEKCSEARWDEGGMLHMCFTKIIFHFTKSNLAEGSRAEALPKHLQISQPCLAPPILQKGMFLWSLDPKPRSSFVAGIDSHGLRKSPTCTQPQQTLNLNPQCHASPAPHSSKSPLQWCSPNNTPCLCVWVRARLPALPAGHSFASCRQCQAPAMHDMKTVARLRKQPGDIPWLV